MKTNKVLIEVKVPEGADVAFSATYGTPFGFQCAEFRILDQAAPLAVEPYGWLCEPPAHYELDDNAEFVTERLCGR